MANPLHPSTNAAPGWRIGDILFDPAVRMISIDGRSERLSKKAAEVLLRLVMQAGQVVSREQLIAEVWNGNAYTGSQGLTYTISQLRRSVQTLTRPDGGGASGVPDYADAIETISKSGYRLLLPVTTPSALSDAEANSLPVAVGRIGDRRRWRWAALAVLLALLLLAGLVLVRKPAGTPPPRALRALTTLDGVEDNPSYSADGRWLAFAWKRAGSPALLRIVDTQQPDQPPHDIADPLGRIERPVWIDDRRLAYLQAVHAESCRVIVVDIVDGSRRDLSACFYLQGAASLAASPDGQWLAFSRRGADEVNLLVLKRLADGREREIGRSPAGRGYGNLAWSHDGRRLALLKLKDTVGDIWTLDIASGEARQLTRLSVPIWALGWSGDDRDLLFSAGLEHDFAIWRLPAGGGTSNRFARLDNVTSLAAIPGGSGDIAASVVRFEDHVERYSMPGMGLSDTIRSSGRDLYADVCGDAQHPIFISFRSRAIGIWYRDGADAEPRQLGLPAGTPEPPVCSPDGSRYATILSPADGGRDSLLIGEVKAGAVPRLVPDASTLGSPSWSLDGRTLILTRDHGGSTELWRFDPVLHEFTALTDDGASFGREVEIEGRRWLFYTREGQRGLWRRELDAAGRTAGPSQPVLDDLALQDWGNWQWRAGQLWSISRDADGDHLVRRALGGAGQRVLSLPKGSIGPYRSLAIDRNGEILLTRHGPTQADIVRVPDERAG